MAEFNLNDVNPIKRDLVILSAIQPHHALMKANRFLLMLVFFLMMVVFVLGLVFLPKQNVIDQIAKQQQNATLVTNQSNGLSTEITALKGQMFSLVSGSIDGKIKSLETNLRRGSITDSLESLEALKTDVKILTTYQQNSVIAEQTEVEKNVIKELSDLKSLIYLTFVSCGLMIAALAGVWLRYQHRISYEKRPLVEIKREED